MQTKPNPLRDAMLGVQQKPAPPGGTPSEPAPEPRKSTVAPSRVGKRSVSAHVDPAVQRQLRILSAETDLSIEDLLAEALNDLFRKHGKSSIA